STIMAASTSGSSKSTELSKAEYLKRYLSAENDVKKTKGKIKKKRRKITGKGLKIVDDDIDWKQMVKEEEEVEDDDEEAPVIAEVIDERPEEVKQMEVFRTGNRWKVIGADETEDTVEENENEPESQKPDPLSKKSRKNSPVRKTRHDSPDISPPRKIRHDSPDVSPPRKARHDSPDLSPPRQHAGKSGHIFCFSPKRPVIQIMLAREWPTLSNKKPDLLSSSGAKRVQRRHDSDSDQSPPRKKTEERASDSDQSPPRKGPRTSRGSDSDQSPPRRQPRKGKESDEDLSPPRRPGQKHGYFCFPKMLSGGKAGLVSGELLRKEQEENRRKEKHNQPLEDDSRNAKTVFRDKSGKRRDLESEREEQRRKAEEKAIKDEKYAQWGIGLAQSQMRQQKLEYAVQEAHKPLARHLDDEDLDRMLREQEREGDPMAAMLRRKKERSTATKGLAEKPRYKGPAPPLNRFNILPGYRWDGVDRSNGFEKKRYERMADKRAAQEAAYKWSVEDM
uniref:BUD13 homolog n=1 Tax=Tetraodon nigroviridis TaxID=99883 RepID=H3CX92_TETNG